MLKQVKIKQYNKIYKTTEFLGPEYSGSQSKSRSKFIRKVNSATQCYPDSYRDSATPC